MAIKTTKRTLTTAVAAAASNGNLLAVPIYQQEQTWWCWDACYQMVFAYNKFQISQCTIAQQVPWQTYGNCCGKPSCCNKGVSVAQIGQGWDHWAYSYNYSSGQISYSAIEATIDSNKVVEVCFIWTAGSGHVVLVVGYDSSGTYVYVNDPGNKSTTLVKYTSLQNAYGKGSWDYTWNNVTSK